MDNRKDQRTTSDVVMCELAEAQFALYGYVCALTGRSQDARDILQETNLRICREAAKYDPSRPFLAWAKTIAVYEVMTYRKKQRRDRLVFDEDVFETIAAQTQSEEPEIDRNLGFLENCVKKLPARMRRVVEERYYGGLTVNKVADRMRCSPNAVSLILMRARQLLSDCVRLAAEKDRGYS